MKTLHDFRLVNRFLDAHGVESTVAVVAVPDAAWSDLVLLAQEWQSEVDHEIAQQEAEIEGLSPEEIAAHEARAEQERKQEYEAILFHSSGARKPLRW